MHFVHRPDFVNDTTEPPKTHVLGLVALGLLGLLGLVMIFAILVTK